MPLAQKNYYSFYTHMKTQSHFLQQSLISQGSNLTPESQIKTSDKPYKNNFSKALFLHVYSFLSKANKQGTSIDIVPPLSTQDEIQFTFSKFTKLIDEDKHHEDQKRSLLGIIANVFKLEIIKIVLLLILVSSLKMYTPFLCAQIIQYASERQTRQIWQGIILLGVVILVLLFKSIAQSQMNYRLGILGVSLSSNLSLLIYNKSLKYPLIRQKEFTASDIINYSQIDCERLAFLGNQLSSLISTPIQLAIGIVIMWIFIGISFLSGLVTTVLMIWITFIVSKYAISFNGEVLKAKDRRMKATQQMLENIRFIKINALQSHFLSKINIQREAQLYFYKKKAWCQAFGYFLYWLTGPMILFTTFTTYILLGNVMTSQAAFTTIMIFSLLQYPIRLLPTSISEVLQMMVSLKRIEKYLQAKEIKENHILHNQSSYSDDSISINFGNFKWKEQQSDNKEKKKIYHRILKNINIQFKRNKLTMVLGPIGCGKSSLLLAILNQMKSSKHSFVKINGKIAYCSQTPWILSNTVRNNIILFEEYDELKFKKVIYYSGLQKDLQQLPKREQTQIGEKGMNISGGQKARISLARALYADHSIYLMDDILSAVDADMANFIMKETIKVYLQQKTVILVTHCLKYAKLADQITIMKKGKIILHDRSINVITSKQFHALKRNQKQEKEEKVQQKTIEELKLIKLAMQSKQKEQNNLISLKIVQELMLPEDQQIGQIKYDVFHKYVQYNGGVIKFGLVVVLAMLLWILSSTFASIFMSMWCQNPNEFENGLIIYVSLSLSSSIFILIRASILIVSSVTQGGIVHRLMINSLLKASLMKFYNRVPIGRIVNRLTKDLRELDEAIGPAVGGLLVCFFQMLGTIVVCIYSSTPYLLIPTFALAYFCWRLKNYYLNAQRQVTRIEKITTTPIINGFVSTLRGLQSVRAYKLSDQFLANQIKCINQNRRIKILKQGLQSWFGLNLTYLSFFVNVVAIGYCLLNTSTSQAIAGLLITYALNLSSDINLTFLCYAYFQTKVISLERIYQFTQIQPEENLMDCPEQQTNTKISGKISFVDACVKYRQDLPNVLENITIKINSGQKIGIAGKSGSGKTSLINAILRIANISSGHLLIDGILINNFPLQKLRKSITVIDQEAIILKGTIRQNIDIYHEFKDEQIIEVLKQSGLFAQIDQKGGLNFQISKDSLSAGEKQIICICRALLRQNPIILIDEATASIDERNDSKLQEIIQSYFKKSTVLTIAHRLDTLSSSDRILILDQGKVVEFGSPTELKKKGGAYHQMLFANRIDI